MRLAVILMSSVLLVAGSASAQGRAPAATEQRVALVVGNSSYLMGPLKNPVNDAEDMAKVLPTLGFRVTLLRNATHQQMIEAINAFGQELKKGGVGLFYFAGHGVQSKGRNYLIPVNARIEVDATALSPDGDLKIEAWGDGKLPVEPPPARKPAS